MPLLVVIGTRNEKKCGEIFDLLTGSGVELRALADCPNAPIVLEDGATFEANARKKASELARALGHWTVGEDSGLVVPALGGRPGVFSARYAGEHGDDEANNDRLLSDLEIAPDRERRAYYVCVACFSDPQGEIRSVAEGRCHGIITHDRRGTGGFGYDPLFLIPEYHRTFGEMSARVKHALSHRARALERLRPALRKLATEGATEGKEGSSSHVSTNAALSNLPPATSGHGRPDFAEQVGTSPNSIRRPVMRLLTFLRRLAADLLARVRGVAGEDKQARMPESAPARGPGQENQARKRSSRPMGK